ncbi:MAG: hypothetical protein SGILL_004457 [Bacillariaceae sp.]
MVPTPYAGKGTQDGVSFDIFNFDLEKAMWVQQLLSNFAYARWNDAYPVIRKKIDAIQARFMEEVARADVKALAAYKEDGPSEMVKMLTYFTVISGETLHEEWKTFFGEVFTRFRDFSVITPADNSRGFDIDSPGLSNEAKRRIVMETGTHYEVPVQRKETGRFRGGSVVEKKGTQRIGVTGKERIA